MYERTPGQRYLHQRPPAPPTEAIPETVPAQENTIVEPERYHANSSKVGLIIGILVLLMAVILVTIGLRPQQHTAPTNSPSSSPTAPTTPTYQPSPGWQGIEFTVARYNAEGYWQVSPAVWADDTVTVTITITVATGTLRYTFFALDNLDSDFFEPTAGTMREGTLAAGENQTGTVIFTMAKGTFTFYLADARGYQITALLVEG